MKKIIIILILIGIVLALTAVFFIFHKSSVASNKFDDFAKCLAAKNIVMYGTPWCEWCQKEKALFSNSFKFVNYIDCSQKSQECVAKQINGTPTWIFGDGRRIEGYQTLEQLSQESGCLLP